MAMRTAEGMDDAYFMSLLGPVDAAEALRPQDDIVVWTKEYVRSQVGAPLQDTASPLQSHGKEEKGAARGCRHGAKAVALRDACERQNFLAKMVSAMYVGKCLRKDSMCKYCV